MKFHKNPPSGIWAVASGRTDRRTWCCYCHF